LATKIRTTFADIVVNQPRCCRQHSDPRIRRYDNIGPAKVAEKSTSGSFDFRNKRGRTCASRRKIATGPPATTMLRLIESAIERAATHIDEPDHQFVTHDTKAYR
jgi:hypothetical protein